MPLKLKRIKGIWHYSGTVAGDRLRGTTRTTSKEIAAQIAAKIETEAWQRHLHGDQTVLTFPQAVSLYLASGRGSSRHDQYYLEKIVRYWAQKARKEKSGEIKVKDMTAGAIRQSAIDIYPNHSGATRNRQVITPTQSVINHCADLEKCPPIRIKRFKFVEKIKNPITLEWMNTFCIYARPVIKALALDMFATACRFGEVQRQDWKDFDFKAQTIKILDTKTGKERIAHMPQPLLVALANLPRDRKPFDYGHTTLRRWWEEDVAKTAEAVPGFERLTFHSCRHGFATKMLRDGVDPKTAAWLGGWADIGLFMKTYAHAMKDITLTDGMFSNRQESAMPKEKISKNRRIR